jgi:hypothetical protein
MDFKTILTVIGGWIKGGFGFMLHNVTFNNVSVISQLSVVLVEENGVPGENHRPVARH